jgi:hypothetical protein
MKTIAIYLLCALAVFLNSGCAIPAVLEGGYRDHFKPAQPANLELYEGRKKILVVYDEISNLELRLKRRAFWVDPEVEPSNAWRPPQFVSPTSVRGLLRIPVTEIPKTSGYSAVMETNGWAFHLYADGQKVWRYTLPDYVRSRVSAKQIVLAPIAVAEGATIVGGVAAIGYAYARPGGSFPAPDPKANSETK